MGDDRLHRSWSDLLGRCGIAGDAAELLARLVAAYTAPGRFYHDLRHVAHVLDVLHEHGQGAREPELLELAAWFHDAVYDPRAKDNEERSADLAVATLRPLHVATERIAALIRMTRDHRAPAGDGDAQLLLDADLAVLGAPPAKYNEYAQAIRREYAWVPDTDYRAGRRAVLTRFLARPAIFGTARLHALWEETARRNLADEIAALEKS